MQFDSIEFLLFLPIVFFLYWLVRDEYRKYVLLFASYVFYGFWDPKYIILIFSVTAISYIAGIMIKQCKNQKIVLVMSILALISILSYFKYFNLIISTFRDAKSAFLHGGVEVFDIILPVGISFYIFQAISYVADSYKDKEYIESNFINYAAYLSFFPQLVAGPIERCKDLLPQIVKKKTFNYEEAVYGLELFAWGYFKKLIIANGLAKYVNLVYDNPRNAPGGAVLVAVVFFSIQIYCDFSGYSDIACGTSKLFGITLTNNFDSPYFSQTIKEFWQRWHISLQRWFREYIYIPMGGSRTRKSRHFINLFSVFMLSGIWHGADYKYIIWALILWILYVSEAVIGYKPSEQFVIKWIKIGVNFIFISFAWIWFRANSIEDGWYICDNIFLGVGNIREYIRQAYIYLAIDKIHFVQIVLPLLCLFVFDYYNQKLDVIGRISELGKTTRWLIYVTFTLFCIIIYPVYTPEYAGFIYFQF